MANTSALTTLQSSPSPSDRIRIALTQMATFRRATLDDLTLELYSARLLKEPCEHVIAALEKIQDLPREAGETALPEIGTILNFVKSVGPAKESLHANGGKTVLAAYECPKCGYRTGGFVEPNDLSTRYCRRCGTPMNEIHRESFA